METAGPSRDAPRAGTGKAGNRAYEFALRGRVVLEGEDDRIASLTIEPLLDTELGEAEALPALLSGLPAEEALQITPRKLAERLGGLPESEMYRSVLLHEALRAALADARGEPRVRSERVLACTCLAVPEPLIRRAILMNGLTRLEEIRCFTKAGASCAQCTSRVAALLASAPVRIPLE